MPNRISNEDIEKYPNLFPVYSFFDAIRDQEFVKTVDYLTKGIGAHTEKVHCIFPNDLDDFDVAQIGGTVPEAIEFSYEWGDETFIDVPTFRYFLLRASEAYLKTHPADKEELQMFLARPQPPLKRQTK